MRFSSNRNGEQIFVRSALSILTLAFRLAQQADDERSMASAATAALPFSQGEDSEAETWCKSQVELIPAGTEKEDALNVIRRASARRRGIVQEGDYNPDPLWQIIEKFAFSMKVDISDEKSLLVKRLRIAARDEDPDRHMRFCEHIVVTLGKISPVAKYIRDTFGLDTAANKIVHCNLLKVHEEGVDSDTAFSNFTNRHCDQCKYRIPRGDEWSYTLEIRDAFQRDNLRFVQGATLKGNGPRYVDHDDLDANG
jgi:hypothetical protein